MCSDRDEEGDVWAVKVAVEDTPDGKPAQREHAGAVPGPATLAVRSDLLDADALRSVAVDNFEIYGSWESQFPPR